MDVYYLHFNIIMQELSGAPYVAGIITYVSTFIIFMLLLAAFTEYQKNGGRREVFKMDTFCRIVGIVAFIVAGCIVLLV